MKKNILSCLITLLSISSPANAQEVISVDLSFTIGGTQFFNSVANRLYNLNDKAELLDFVRTKVLVDPNVSTNLSPSKLLEVSAFINSPLDRSGIIVLRREFVDYSFDAATGTATINEGPQVLSTVIHRERGRFSDYLLETKNLMFVMIGGETDIQKSAIEVKYKRRALATSFDDLRNLISVAMKGSAAATTLVCRIVVMKTETILAPCDIAVKITNLTEPLKYEIHEKAFAQFKAGVSFSSVRKRNFNLDNGQLSVSLDEGSKEKWKSDLIAIFDFYPWGRDLDRLDAIWKKGAVSFEQRLGFFAGLRISKDPLQGIYYGLSLSPVTTISIMVGASSILDTDQQTVDVGQFTSLNDAKNLLKRRYITQFFIGLSFAPSEVTKFISK